MARASEDFLRFLLANYPDDYRRASVTDVKEDVLAAIMSKHAHHYQIWCKIPDWIKDNHGDRIPTEVLNGNKTTQSYINEEIANKQKDDQNTSDMLNFSVSMLALGYSEDTVAELMKNREAREELIKAAKEGKLPDALRALWRETRLKDLLAISKDWKKNQPEKHLFHIAKMLSLEERNLQNSASSKERSAAEREITTLRKELMDFATKLNSRQSKQNMVDYLRGQPQQAALRHLNPEVLSLFTGVMRDHGIKIEPVNSALRSLSHYESLSQSLKQDFDLMKKSEQFVSDMTNRSNKSMARMVDMRTAKKNDKSKSKSKLIPLKKTKENVAMRA